MVRPKEKRRPQAHRAGFTLTELMMVVTVIAITAGLAAPTMYNAFAERRAASAPLDLLKLVRRGRSEAMAYGRAHLIRFDGTSPGSFTLYRGVSSSCLANDWSDGGPLVLAASTNPCGAPGTDNRMCIEKLDLSGSYYKSGSLEIRATESGAATDVDVCFEPTGRTLFATGGAALSDSNTIGGGLIFNFRRHDGGSPIGVVRQVVIPLGGDARLLR